MHIGRATTVLPEQLQHHANEVRATLDLTRASPTVIAHDSAPTGAGRSPMPVYNPVTDLIQRQTQVAQAIATAVSSPQQLAREAYGGTPPTPSVLDLTA